MNSRLPGRAVIGALVAIAMIIAAAIGVNIYLNTEYLPRLVGAMRPGLVLEYESAWSLWPGTVFVEKLSVRGEEPGFTWHVSARRASASAQLSSLTGDTKRLDSLKLTGVRVRIRPKLHPLDATPERLAQLPALPGEPPVDLLEEGPLLPPDERRVLDPWRIEVASARVDRLEELWIDLFRFEGRMDATGSFQVAPGRVTRFLPTEVKVRDGSLYIAGEVAADQLRGEARVSLGPVDHFEGRGLAHFATAAGEASLQGQVRDVGFLRELPGLPAPVALKGGAGPVQTRLLIKDSLAQPGSTLEWSTESLRGEIDGFVGVGGISVRAAVELVEGAPRTRVSAMLLKTQLGRPGQPPLVKSEALELAFDGPQLDVRRLSMFPEDLLASWRKWPARCVLTAPILTGQQRALQWWVSFGRLETQLDLSKLSEHRIALRGARMDRARVRVRPRVQKADATDEYLALLPPMSGMPPPLRTEDTAASLSARTQRNPWSIELEVGVVSDLREVWLEAYRFEGRASARGSFRYEAGGRLEAGPVEARVERGTLTLANWKAASDVHGVVAATLARTDLDAVDGHGFFRGLSTRADVGGVVEEVEFLRHFPNLPVPAELGGGRGPLTARVSLKDGVVASGSEVRWSSPSAEAATHGYRVVGPLELEAHWGGSAGTPKLRLDARLSPYSVTRVGSTRALVDGRLLSLRMDAAPFDLARPAFEPFSSLQAIDGQVPDLRVLNDYAPSDLPLKVMQGSGTFTGKVSWPHQGKASAELKLGGKQTVLAYIDERLKGDWSLEARLGNVNLSTADSDIVDATVLIDDMALKEGALSADRWFGRIDVSKGKVRPGERVLLEANVDTTLRDGRPLVALFMDQTEAEALPGWVGSMVRLQALRTTARVRVGQGLLEIDELNARGQSMEILGRVRKNGTRQWGDMLVRSRGQEVGVAVRGSRLELKLLRAAEWYRQQRVEHRW
ncbi:MAG: hypothetical protein WBV82_01455 [Myxococcaceae bacterium]